MNGLTREDVVRMAVESGVADEDLSSDDCAVTDYGDATDSLCRFAAMAFAAGQAADRADNRREYIDALVGDRLTAQKADHICERDGYAISGVVMSLPDGRACIVNRSAVRWLEKGDLFNLLHTDTAINQRLIDEAVAAERNECAGICDRFSEREMHPAECASAIRARGKGEAL